MCNKSDDQVGSVLVQQPSQETRDAADQLRKESSQLTPEQRSALERCFLNRIGAPSK